MNTLKKRILQCIFILTLFSLSACTKNNTASDQNSEQPNQLNNTENPTDNGENVQETPVSPSIEEPTVPVGTRTNPLPLNTTALFDGSESLFDTYKAEITLLDVTRGKDALAMAIEANQFNTEPAKGKEYLFAKFRVRVLSSENDTVIDINNASFDLVSENGKTYDSYTPVSGITPSLRELYAGGTMEGYACFEVDIDDAYPSIVFLERNNHGIWFSTDPDASLATGSTVYVPSENIPKPDTSNALLGTRLNPYSKGEQASFDGTDTLFDTYKATIILKDVIRGDAAMDIVANANRYNEVPGNDKEYLLAHFEVSAQSSKDDAKIEISSANFELVSEDGVKYDEIVSIAGLEPNLTTMYPGNTQDGYACFLVDKKDQTPNIVFLERDNGGLWFSTK